MSEYEGTVIQKNVWYKSKGAAAIHEMDCVKQGSWVRSGCVCSADQSLMLLSAKKDWLISPSLPYALLLMKSSVASAQ